jgi:acetyltransferase
LRRQGHGDKVSVVHPAAEQIDGFAVYKRIRDVPGPVHVAYVSLPAASILGVLGELETAGCRSAVVPTGGFSEAEFQRLRDFTAQAAMAVHGPNCMGVINYSDRLPLWSSGGVFTERDVGNIALITQSAAAAFLADATEGANFSKIISTGNEVGLRTSDYARWLAGDPHTRVVGAVLDSIVDADDFVDAVAVLRKAGKPIVVLKAGGSRAGALATKAHTGALIGGQEAYRAFFRSLDVPLVHDYDEMAVALSCLANPWIPRPAGARLGIVTDSGGEAALMADLAELEAVELAEFSPATTAALRSINNGIEVNNPLDAGSAIEATGESYLESYQQVIADPDVDSLLVVVEAQASAPTGQLSDSHPIVSGIRMTAERLPGKPVLAVSSSSINTSPDFRQMLGPRVPLLRGMRNGLVAARALAGNRRPVPERRDRPSPPPGSLDQLRAAVAEHSGPLDARLTRRLLMAYDLPLVGSVLVVDANEAETWAEGRYPVVVKAASTAIPHRSDIGAVITNVRGPGELRAACQLIADRVRKARPGVRLDFFEVQQQVDGEHESMLGFLADPVFGALVSVGTGGTLVELRNDVAFGLAPIDLDEARWLISRTELGRLLSGYRNLLPVTDLLPLADMCVRVSWLARDFLGLLAECDLNPTFVEPVTGRVCIGDALLVTG